MTSRKAILLVVGNAIDRNTLKEMLPDEYAVWEAPTGEDGVRLLQAQNTEIAAVIFELQMLTADDKKLRSALLEKNSDLPVLVIADEHSTDAGCLFLFDAWDFVSKPFCRTVLLHRLQNVMACSRFCLAPQNDDLSQQDKLTGLDNRESFMRRAKKLIVSHPETTYTLIRMDVDRFREFNAFFGSAAGDDLLKTIAEDIQRDMTKGQICGRIESDVFCICAPYEPDVAEAFCEKAARYAQKFQKDYFLKFSFGIYIVTDPEMEMEQIYSHAAEAAKKGKHETNTTCTFYDEAMAEQAARERQIIDEFEAALTQRQFEVYLQPQCSLLFGTLSGAEALVRWRHPERGLIMPGEFIPVIEKNGMITKLDTYMVESVCMILHRWLENSGPVSPISLNLSRVSLYNTKIEHTLCALTDQYHIPRSLIPIEITESAYMNEPERMLEIINSLHQEGFDVHMDNFGSGYSSLNMLKAFDVDMLKIDMRFLPAKQDDVRSGKILASVLRMAHWLGLPVVVEGVETKEQTEFLVGAGCQNVQGYYFARPMPVSQYEQLQNDSQTLKSIREKTKITAHDDHIISDHLNAGYTAHEMRTMLILLSAVFDLVRVVEPTESAVITFRPDDTVCSEPYACFKFLGKHERCENCTSLCALQGQCVLTKYELIDKDIFYFASRPLKITMFDGSDKNLVLEIVSRVTEETALFDQKSSILRDLITQARKNMIKPEPQNKQPTEP